ncbi:hypothetical protein [Marinicella litoralis]|uniref:Lipoprotein n=1 Tax=Marinicella litoralis TaxID=644220 RepID=A0A4V3DH06_9GAMM|nr:hypothetical protein [Marinicella litoralis]TDR16371.1 hypothetical protein C8D91_2898 [Marinicella litoralis]
MKTIIVFLFSIFILGCSNKVSLNIGESDYRVAKDDQTFIKKYEQDASMESRIIHKDESISVHLKQAFISDYSERFEKTLSYLFTNTVRGEIAIVARVFEQGQGEVLDFRNSATKNKGRLIYYSEDVRSGGQFLNLSMLPIYGPITYKGNPLIIQLTVLELDVGEAQQTKALLSTLATLGAKAYAPASPVMKSLEALGEQLLSGEQDDIELQYIFVLHPEGGRFQTAKYSQVATGDYIIMRQQPNKNIIEDGRKNRFDQQDWKSYRYCSEHGRIYIKDKDKDCSCDKTKNNLSFCEYRDQTYLIVQINSGFSALELDSVQTFLEFQEEMEQAVNNNSFDTKMSAAIDEYQTQVETSNKKTKVEKISNEVIAKVNLACTSDDEKIAKHYIQETFDRLVKKANLPDGITDFTNDQWSRMLFEIRKLSGNPYDIEKDKINAVTDGPALAALLNCNVKLN